MGATALRVCQFGKETTWGISVAATARWMGLHDVRGRPVRRNVARRYLTGSFQPAHKVVQTDRRGQVAVAGDFTFEDLIYVLLSGVKGGVVGAGAGAAKTWTFPFPLTASPAVESRTLEIYDGQQEYALAGGLVESFQLSGASGDDAMVQFSANWIGKDMTASTLTGALVNRAVDALPTAVMQLYADDAGGTIGTTALAGTLISWTFDYRTGIHLKKFQSGALNPSTFGYNVPDITLRVVCEFNAAGAAQVAKYDTATVQLVRLTGQGPLIGGTDYKRLTIDGAYHVDDIGELWGDRDGNTTLEITFKPVYDTTYAKYGQIEIVNAVATAIG